MIDDVPVNLFGHATDFHRVRPVNRIEQRRKSITEVKATTAAVAGIKNALKLLKKRNFVVELV
jgi:hypothetical protein